MTTQAAELFPVVAVGAVVLASGPWVLLVRRATPPMLGHWSLPGGRLRGGESITAAVEREVLEETGIRVAAGSLIEVVEIMTDGYHYVVHDHLCLPVDPAQVPEASDDVSDARYVRPSELSQMGVTEAVVRVVRKGLAMRQALNEDE
ncbi:MAG TPA: NUDIX domain-containing protein [Polyangiaceae bacterium]